MMHLSRHFINNWIDRVGGHPTGPMVADIIQNSVRVQKGRKLKKTDGTPFNTLTVYWHPDLKLIVQVDQFNDTAVSVLSKANTPFPDQKQTAPYYTPMTMHRI